jgi:hypothetical protein
MKTWLHKSRIRQQSAYSDYKIMLSDIELSFRIKQLLVELSSSFIFINLLKNSSVIVRKRNVDCSIAQCQLEYYNTFYETLYWLNVSMGTTILQHYFEFWLYIEGDRMRAHMGQGKKL